MTLYALIKRLKAVGHDHSAFRRLASALDSPGSRVLERKGGEREIAINGIIANGLAAIYMIVIWSLYGKYSTILIVEDIASTLFSVAACMHCRRYPNRSPARRYTLLLVYLIGISMLLAQLTPYAGIWSSLYLWVIVGYAFRFGLSYLRVASLLSLVLFSITIVTTPYWQSLPFVTAGTIVGIIVIPAYFEALLHRALNETNRMEASNKAKSYLLSSISHDLRTPLSAISGMAEVLTKTVLSPDQQTMLGTMRSAVNSVVSDIDALLDLSRIEAGYTDVTMTDFPVIELAREVIGLYAHEAQLKHLQLGLYVGAATPLLVTSDRKHLKKILANLLSNAIKFTNVGSIVITIDARTSAGRKTLRVEVADTGMGVPHYLRTQIFDAYTQVNAEVLSDNRGIGLGLNIAQHLVTLVGGKIGVTSNSSGGSTFWVELAAIEPHSVPTDDIIAPTVTLLLSREPARVHHVAARLEKLGIRTLVLRQGVDVEPALLAALDDHTRFVLMIDGLGVDAVDAAEAVRRNPLYRRLPLVLLATTRGLPPLAVRRHFLTAVSDLSSDNELYAAIHHACMVSGGSINMTSAPGYLPHAMSTRRVLLAFDSRTLVAIIRGWLRDEGHVVSVADSGEEALDLLDNEDFDLGIFDLDMVEMPGIEVTQMHRAGREISAHFPVIGITADGSSLTQDQCAAAGLEACLVQPIDRRRLMSAVSDLLASVQQMPSNVAQITSHSRFHSDVHSNSRELDSLTGADKQAVQEVLTAFQLDIVTALDHLTIAANTRDAELYRRHIVTLGASASAIGATRLAALCASGDRLSTADLIAQARDLMSQIRRETERVCGSLRSRC